MNPSHNLETLPSESRTVSVGDAFGTPLCTTSLPWGASESPASGDWVSPVPVLSDTSGDFRVWEDHSTSIDNVPCTALNFNQALKADDEALPTEDVQLPGLVSLTEDLVSFTFAEISENDDFTVRMDTPLAKQTVAPTQSSFPAPSDSARSEVSRPRARSHDEENRPPPKWSPIRIAQDLHLANPVYAHARPVSGKSVKPFHSPVLRVPLADITKIVENELEKKKGVVKSKIPTAKNCNPVLKPRRNTNLTTVRMLR